ncbi:MAG: toll/interleukin-1 receptor domain-containing protein [Bacteroidota bacterium]|nr:toll/interleukin-1 receptor domain-containing protein [Bacteroidota bacterium]
MTFYNLYIKDNAGHPIYKIALSEEQIKRLVESFLKGKKTARIKGGTVNIENPLCFNIYDISRIESLGIEQAEIEFNIVKYIRLYGKNGRLSEELLRDLGANVTDNFLKGKDWGSMKEEFIAETIPCGIESGKIFISHSSKDAEIVKLFIDRILVLGLKVKNEDIFCTSVDGMGIKSGDDFKSKIKFELCNCKAVIQLISQNYKESEICLNEMGASWVLNSNVIPIIIPPMRYDVGFIHTNTQQLRINTKSDLMKLHDHYKDSLFIANIYYSELTRQIDEFLKSLENLIMAKSNYETSDDTTTKEPVYELSQPSKNEIESYFIDTIKFKPVVAHYARIGSTEYIVGICNKSEEDYLPEQHLCILKMFAKRWQLEFDKTLDEFGCFADVSESQIVTHHKKTMFYIERVIHSVGNATESLGCLEFGIFDFSINEYIKLTYFGKYRGNKIEGEFDFKEFAKTGNAEYLGIIETHASSSKNIYQTPINYNIDAFENYIEKWIIENRSFYTNEEGSINFLYYNDDMFSAEFEYDQIVENNTYKIGYCFAGPAVCFDKVKGKYFVVLIPEGMGGGGSWGVRSINKVSLLTDESILAKNGYESYQINLKSGIYLRTPFDDIDVLFTLSD